MTSDKVICKVVLKESRIDSVDYIVGEVVRDQLLDESSDWVFIINKTFVNNSFIINGSIFHKGQIKEIIVLNPEKSYSFDSRDLALVSSVRNNYAEVIR